MKFLRDPAFLRSLAALAAGAMLAVLANEALLRSAYFSPGQYVLDPLLGVDRVPYSQVLVTLEGGARLNFDRYGLNNDDTAWDRPGRRIGVLGDSFTEAAEVPRAANYVTRLAEAWPDWVVLNLGRAAMTPPQAVELHRRISERERLDLLLLAVSENDLDELAESGSDAGCTPPAKPIEAWRRKFASVVGASSLLSRTQLRLRIWREGLGQDRAGDTAPVLSEGNADAALVERFASCLAMLAGRQPLAVLLLPGSRLANSEAIWQHGLRRQALVREAVRRVGALAVVDAWAAFGRDPLGDGRLVNGFANHILGAGHLNPLGHGHLGSLLAGALAPLLRGSPREQPEQVAEELQAGR